MSIITNKDINKIIRDSMKLDELDRIDEAYVAQPKQYDLKTKMLWVAPLLDSQTCL